MKKLLYTCLLLVSITLFVSCTKSEANDPINVQIEQELQMLNAAASGSYIIVSSLSTSGLASAVNTKLAQSSLYKLAGGPYVYIKCGTGPNPSCPQYHGQALYK